MGRAGWHNVALFVDCHFRTVSASKEFQSNILIIKPIITLAVAATFDSKHNYDNGINSAGSSMNNV